jgi:hypothetical protein
MIALQFQTCKVVMHMSERDTAEILLLCRQASPEHGQKEPPISVGQTCTNTKSFQLPEAIYWFDSGCFHQHFVVEN